MCVGNGTTDRSQFVIPLQLRAIMKFKSIILTLIFFVGILWFRSADKQRKSADSFGKATAVVESLPEYAQHQDFFDKNLAEFHDRAFGLAYKRGRLQSSFGENIYRTVLLKQFMNDAEAVGNTEMFEAMKRELEKPEPEAEPEPEPKPEPEPEQQ